MVIPIQSCNQCSNVCCNLAYNMTAGRENAPSGHEHAKSDNDHQEKLSVPIALPTTLALDQALSWARLQMPSVPVQGACTACSIKLGWLGFLMQNASTTAAHNPYDRQTAGLYGICSWPIRLAVLLM
jgi:hypothetical protein